MTRLRITKRKVTVNIFPDPIKFLILEIPRMASENNKLKRLEMAEVMLDAVRELLVPKKMYDK